jgi:hypothetical protein
MKLPLNHSDVLLSYGKADSTVEYPPCALRWS